MATIQIEALKYKLHVGCVPCDPIYVADVGVVQVMWRNYG